MAFTITPPSKTEAALPESIVQNTGTENASESSSSLFADPVRNTLRSVSRGGEAFLGLPADLVQGGASIANIAQTYATGSPSEFLSNIPYIPTSERIRESLTTPLLEKLGGKGYGDPQGKWEEVSDETFSDLGALFFPIKGRIPFMGALTRAGLGNLAKLAAKEVGFGEGAQEGIKLATMIATSMGGAKKIKGIAQDMRNIAKKAIPEGATYSSKTFKPVYEKLVDLEKWGDLSQDLKKKVSGLKPYFERGKTSVKKGKIPVRRIVNLTQDINKHFYKGTPTAAFNDAFEFLKDGSWKFLNNYGKTNPTFIKNFKDSTDIFRGLYQSNSINGFLHNTIGNMPYVASRGLIGGLLGGGRGGAAIGGLGAAMGATAGKRFIDLMTSNPTVQKLYGKLIGSAAAQNTKQATKYIKALDKEYRKTFPEKEQSFSITPPQ